MRKPMKAHFQLEFQDFIIINILMYVHYLRQQSVCTNALLSHVAIYTFNTVCEEYLNRHRLTVNGVLHQKTLGSQIPEALMTLTMVHCSGVKTTVGLEPRHHVLEQC